ncbi:caspase-3-like [Plakobranchus ocellatus]|uniref:Caspase-3-like n=1 Tax=Plakobranchus ocellatus TaxID=259542 RepID=A0AAV3Y5X0_9GAST|nr:caspase-3-like [Plakobranchus ocellatus]
MEHHKAGGDEDGDVYDFNYLKRGLAVIINNEDFSPSSDFDDRPGSSYDASALYHSFAHLGFDVLLYSNLTAWKMVEVLRAAARDYDHENADCFVCSVLTHGDQTWSNREYDRMGLTVRQDLLFGTDGKAVATRTVVELFNDTASPGLRGKPRLFFLQACRGNKLDEGQEMHVVTPIRGIRHRHGKDMPDAADGGGDGTLEAGKETIHTEDTGTAVEPAQRQTSLSSSVDPPGYPKIEDKVDAQPAPDDEDDENNHHQRNTGLTEEESQSTPSSSQKASFTDAYGEGQASNVDHFSGFLGKVQDVPVSPAPLYKDCLVMYATPPGYFAWRRKNGAWFIQSLCKVLDSRHLGNLSLVRALVQVNGFVARNYQSENPSKPSMHAKKEMPVIESMLVKDIFLTQKRRF